MTSQRRDQVFSSGGLKSLRALFGGIRAQLDDKERELNEVQWRDASLRPPDEQQMNALSAVIASLHLSTEDGSFVFFSEDAEHPKTATTKRSPINTGMQAIKDLPRSTWIRPGSSHKNIRRVIFIPRYPKGMFRSSTNTAGGKAKSVFELQPMFKREFWVKQQV